VYYFYTHVSADYVACKWRYPPFVTLILNKKLQPDLSALTHTRGHKYKLYKQQSSVNVYTYFFSNRVCDIWNSLSNFVVEASSSDNFRRLLNQVDLS